MSFLRVGGEIQQFDGLRSGIGSDCDSEAFHFQYPFGSMEVSLVPASWCDQSSFKVNFLVKLWGAFFRAILNVRAKIEINF